MTNLIDQIILDETNEEFKYASEFVKDTDKTVFLTGKAGTGKTTFLKYLKQTTLKKTVILAPTGVAAINAGGQTINSFFQLPFGPFILNDKRLRTKKDSGEIDETTIYSTFKYGEDKKTIIKQLELLIIDEVSMVRCDTLDVIDRILRVFRKKPHLPYGGVQVTLIGDAFQLPPIAKVDQWNILKEYYDSSFFFSSKIFNDNKPIYIELKKIYRQKEQEFIEILNKIRINNISDFELQTLNKKYNPTFSSNSNDNHIILSTTNAQVDQTNSTKLEQLTTELKIYEGEVIGTFPKNSNGSFVLPTEQDLRLKVGSQVMILKNDPSKYKRYFNGKIGNIKSLEETSIIVQFDDESNIQIEKTSWTNIQYTWNKEKRKIEETVIGTFTQYPLRLAWSITVHKSQGLTFEKVYADLGSAFEDGQVYVALSRCTSLNGLVLKTQIPRDKISTNKKVLEFAKKETPSTLIMEELVSGKADFHYKKVRKDIRELKFENAYNNLTKAIKFRNDIETDSFKKYFITTASKLASFNLKYKNLHNAFEVIKEENKNYQSSNSEFEILNSELTSKVDEQVELIEMLDSNLKLQTLSNSYKPTSNDEDTFNKQFENKIKDLEIANQKYESENLGQKNIIKNLINNAPNPAVPEFIANNFIYEKSQRGADARKEWLDSLDGVWRQILGLKNIKYYYEILDILNNLSQKTIFISDVKNLSPIKHLTNLTSLEISGPSLVNIEPLEYLVNLTHLILEELHGYGAGGSSNYRYPSTYNCIIDLNPIRNLTKLVNLELSCFEISDINPLYNLTNLKKLSISQVNQDWERKIDFSVIEYLEKLDCLKLNKNRLRNIYFVYKLTNLKELEVSSNLIKDISPLSYLTNLETLYLSSNTSTELYYLTHLSKLSKLHLGGNKIDDISSLRELNNLTELGLENNLITDITPLENLTNLSRLFLNKNQISTFESLRNLSNLVLLVIANNGKIKIKGLRQLNKLSDLYLNDNEIEDLETLFEMTYLKTLYIPNCNVPQEVQIQLKTLLTECSIQFEDNQLPY
jgi:Leucine-rich repeat (LRR) protein